MRQAVQTAGLARRPVSYAAQRRAQVKSFPAPIGGWVSNRNLSTPNVQGLAPGAAVLENWFPTATGVVMRRGSQDYAQLGDGTKDATALFSYKNGNQKQIFGATDDAIYDITTIVFAENQRLADDSGNQFATDTGDVFGWDSTIGKEVITGRTGGDWVVVQFENTAGDIFLVGVNGKDDSIRYDGTNWFNIGAEDINSIAFTGQTTAFTVGDTLTGGTSGATANIVKVISDGSAGTLWIGPVTGGPFQASETITDGGGGSATASGTESLLASGITGVNTTDLCYVWTYKERLFFIEKDSLNAWYLDLNAIGGAAHKLPFGGVFDRGGSLLFGSGWSLDSGSGGSGLSEHCAFFTTEGQVAVYQGADPSDSTDWSRVGVYRIGRPLGKSAHIRAGGDIVVATDVGFVPLSQAVQRDYAALSPSAVSYPIEEAWNSAVANRSGAEWKCAVWPAAQMVIVALPTVDDEKPMWFVANARTGAWAPFTGWDATCVEIFDGRCFFGSSEGMVIEANVTGLDRGQLYTTSLAPLFEDLRSPTALKVMKMAKAVLRGGVAPIDQITMQFDFEIDAPPAPNAASLSTTDVWGGAIWGESIWGEETPAMTFQNWRDVDGSGYAASPLLQISSGSIAPLDTQLVRIDVAYEVTDAIV